MSVKRPSRWRAVEINAVCALVDVFPHDPGFSNRALVASSLVGLFAPIAEKDLGAAAPLREEIPQPALDQQQDESTSTDLVTRAAPQEVRANNGKAENRNKKKEARAEDDHWFRMAIGVGNERAHIADAQPELSQLPRFAKQIHETHTALASMGGFIACKRCGRYTSERSSLANPCTGALKDATALKNLERGRLPPNARFWPAPPSGPALCTEPLSPRFGTSPPPPLASSQDHLA